MSTTLQIRVDDDVKAAVDSLFASMGLDISTAIRMFFFASLRENGIPFELKRTFNQETINAMLEARNHQNLTGPFSNAHEAIQSMLED
jgi:DNA-damage-inducible protein J